MRKLVILSFTLAFVLAVFIAPASAQTNQLLTIADLIRTQSQANPAEFTILAGAVRAADPIFAEMLANRNSRVTVFAPTDAAFNELITALGTTPQNLLSDRALLNDLLSYHVVPASVPAESLIAMNGAYLGTLLRGEVLSIALEGESVIVNESTVTESDLFASNGVVHVVDTVLAPRPALTLISRGNIMETITANATARRGAQFTVLAQALRVADPAVLATLSGRVPYTLFAPTDEAFNALLEQMDVSVEELLADRERLTAILQYHVVLGSISLDNLVDLNSTMETGGTLRLASLIPSLTVDIDLSGGAFAVNYANVILPDVVTSNGVIHVIDAVLVPPQL